MATVNKQESLLLYALGFGIIFVVVERSIFGWSFDINDYGNLGKLDRNILSKQIECAQTDEFYQNSRGWFWRCNKQCMTLKKKLQKCETQLSRLETRRKKEAIRVRHTMGLWSSFSVCDTRIIFWEDMRWGYNTFTFMYKIAARPSPSSYNSGVFEGMIGSIVSMVILIFGWPIFAGCGLFVGFCTFCYHLWLFTSGFGSSGWIYYILTVIGTGCLGLIGIMIIIAIGYIGIPFLIAAQ